MPRAATRSQCFSSTGPRLKGPLFHSQGPRDLLRASPTKAIPRRQSPSILHPSLHRSLRPSLLHPSVHLSIHPSVHPSYILHPVSTDNTGFVHRARESECFHSSQHDRVKKLFSSPDSVKTHVLQIPSVAASRKFSCHNFPGNYSGEKDQLACHRVRLHFTGLLGLGFHTLFEKAKDRLFTDVASTFKINSAVLGLCPTLRP